MWMSFICVFLASLRFCVCGARNVETNEIIEANFTGEEFLETMTYHRHHHRRKKGDTRCICNLPECVSTGYMCRSALGSCFTELLDKEGSKWRLGCLEMVDNNRRGSCTEGGGGLVCCKEDLCNYMDTSSLDRLDIHIQVNTRNNQTGQGGQSRSPEGSIYYGQDAATIHQNLWFKAATIAVPIAGGFILILLVILAMRMLRTDSKRHSGVIDRRLKTGLLLGGGTGGDVLPPCGKSGNYSCGSAAVDVIDKSAYRNVNISIPPENLPEEKIFNKCIVMWGRGASPTPV